MDFKIFFDGIRAKLFSGSLSQTQVDGINVILDKMSEFSDTILRNQAAYIFATAFHETGATMQPVRETFAASDKQAMARLETAWKSGKLPWVKKPYWRTGWFGRGYVQLTHKTNYQKMSDILNIDLVNDRDLALDEDVAADVLIEGMMKGLSGKGDFTGHKLEDYVNLSKSDYMGARRVVNGIESASKIKGYATKFEAALEKAGFDTARSSVSTEEIKAETPQNTDQISEIRKKISELEELLEELTQN